MTGLLGLLGGREHGPGCEPIDRLVLEATGRPDPLVAVVPLASSLRTRARTVGRAVGWWDELGATTVVAGPDADATRRLIDRADIVVLPGGVPDRLHHRLLDSGLVAHLVARWQAGVHLVGSSSGAMVVGSDRQTVRPPFAVRPGFGLLPGVAVAPHHELTVPRTVAAWRARTHPHTVIVGIDEATGLVGRDGRFRVLGEGHVTVRRGAWVRVHGSGDEIDLRRLGIVPAAAPAVPTPLDTRRDPRPVA